MQLQPTVGALANGEGAPSLPLLSPFPSLLFSPFPFFPPHFTFLSPPLRSRSPEIQLGVLGERCKLPGKVWGLAPAKIEFGTFLP